MDLSAGTRLGAYRIEGSLAAGGMGKIYRATHVKLGRPVAIKMVADEIAKDPVALARFRREARAASRLSHSHICTVHDFSEEEGQPFLVLELLSGETLEERLSRGPLAIDQTVRIGAAIADALGHAHGRGLLHRDLKPGNVMLTDAGVKVLDFGLAKAARAGEVEPGSMASLVTVTAEDSIPGTIPYMSPEQLEGREADARSDIWALGVILYEMLTGRRPFDGSTRAMLAAAILASSPRPIHDLRPDAPRALVRVVERCLTRHPQDRWQAARDLAVNLEWLTDDLGGGDGERRPRPATARPRSLWGRSAALAGLGAGGLAALFATVVALSSGPPSGEPVTFSLNPPPGVTFTEGSRNVPTVSPDGSHIAFIATDSTGYSGLWVRSLSAQEAVAVTGPSSALRPFWSPDGSMIGFFTLASLGVVSADGGPVRPVADVTMESRGASWSARAGILFAAGADGGLSLADPGTGSVVPVTEPDRARGEIGHLWPDFLPDGHRFLYFAASSEDSIRGIYIASLSDPRGRRLVASDASGRYANGYLLYLLDGDLVARRFDAPSGRLDGVPRTVARDVAVTDAHEGAFTASETGVLAYATSTGKNSSRLVLLDDEGREELVVGELRHQRNPTLSPDEQRIAVDVYRGAQPQVMVLDLATGGSRPVAASVGESRYAVWSPDGRRLAFATRGVTGWDLVVAELDRAEAPRSIYRGRGTVMPTSWSPDGRHLAFNALVHDGTNFDVLLVDPEGSGDAEVFLTSGANEVGLRFSPDGKRIAYVADESGKAEVYIQPNPPTGVRCLVSVGGGWDPVWDPSGELLYYLGDGGILNAVDLPTRPGRCPSTRPRPLFRTHVTTPGTSRNHFEILRDGRFLLNQRDDHPTSPEVQLILNWTVGVE